MALHYVWCDGEPAMGRVPLMADPPEWNPSLLLGARLSPKLTGLVSQ